MRALAAERAPWLLAGVFVAQAVVLSVIRSGTSYDGAEQLLYTQYVDLGYGRSQPPLFTWMLMAVQAVLGVSQIAENLLKFALLAAGFGAVWQMARRLGHDAGVATAAMLSLFLVVEIGFEAQRNYTHSVLLFALMGAIGCLYLALLERRSRAGFAVLGLLCGAILLSKYNAVLLLAALVAADLSVRGAGVFRARESAIVWPLAILVVAPHAIWAVGNIGHVFALSDGFVGGGGGEGDPWALAVLRAAGFYAVASLGLLGPLGIVAGLVWWRGRRAGGPELPGGRVPMNVRGRVLWRWALIVWGIGLLVALAGPASEVRMRWLIPVAVPLVPVVIGAVLARMPRAKGPVIAVGLALGGISTAGQWPQSLWINARTDYDYAALAAAMAAEGLPADLVVMSYAEFANLRLYGPRAVVTPVVPDPARIAPMAATVIWAAARERDAARVLDFARDLGLCVDAARPEAGFAMPRRHGEGALAVRMRAVSRAACGL